jgi:hypothetical protein
LHFLSSSQEQLFKDYFLVIPDNFLAVFIKSMWRIFLVFAGVLLIPSLVERTIISWLGKRSLKEQYPGYKQFFDDFNNKLMRFVYGLAAFTASGYFVRSIHLNYR